MARSVLVTIADENYLDPARQLFSCVHFNAGWSGDLLLLAHEVPEAKLAPFRERGIQVRPVETRQTAAPGARHPSAVLAKFQLFTPQFREWESILYLDGDMMYWASLDALVGVRGLHAISDRTDLGWQFREPPPGTESRQEDLRRSFDLRAEAFNTGMLAFRSDVIRDDDLESLETLYARFEGMHKNGDQGVMNLHFGARWHRIPDFYAALRHVPARYFRVPKEQFRSIGRHFVGNPRVWDASNPWHEEWRASLARFDELDARSPRPPARVWSDWEIRCYWAYLHLRRTFLPTWQRLRRSYPAKLLRRANKKVRGVRGTGRGRGRWR